MSDPDTATCQWGNAPCTLFLQKRAEHRHRIVLPPVPTAFMILLSVGCQPPWLSSGLLSGSCPGRMTLLAGVRGVAPLLQGQGVRAAP